MKKTLVLLLASGALLMACGAEEEPETTAEAADEGSHESTEVAEEQSDETAEEGAAGAGTDNPYGGIDDDDFFSIHYHQGEVEIENRLEDASDIAGFYAVALPQPEDEYSFDAPRETFIDIKDDGRATVLSYQVLDGNDEASQDHGHRFLYIDEQQALKSVDEPIPVRVTMASGYMIQEYGQIEFKKGEKADITVHLNEHGEMTVSSVFNPVQNFNRSVWSFDPSVNDLYVFSPFELSLETATLTEVDTDNVRLPFLIHDGGFISVAQLELILVYENSDRVQKAMQFEAFEDDPTKPYIENYNELLHHVNENERLFGESAISLADDPSEYTGFTQDNTEIVPEFVLISDTQGARTLHEDGTVLEYDSENRAWLRTPY